MTYDPSRLGKLIRRHREAARLTQLELAQKAGITDKKLSRIEQGFVQDPGFGDVIPITSVLGLTPNQVASQVGLWSGGDEKQIKDERWDWVMAFLERSGPKTIDRFLDMAYSAAITADRLSAAPEAPKRLRRDTSRIPV